MLLRQPIIKWTLHIIYITYYIPEQHRVGVFLYPLSSPYYDLLKNPSSFASCFPFCIYNLVMLFVCCTLHLFSLNVTSLILSSLQQLIKITECLSTTQKNNLASSPNMGSCDHFSSSLSVSSSKPRMKILSRTQPR